MKYYKFSNKAQDGNGTRYYIDNELVAEAEYRTFAITEGIRKQWEANNHVIFDKTFTREDTEFLSVNVNCTYDELMAKNWNLMKHCTQFVPVSGEIRIGDCEPKKSKPNAELGLGKVSRFWRVEEIEFEDMKPGDVIIKADNGFVNTVKGEPYETKDDRLGAVVMDGAIEFNNYFTMEQEK